MMDAYVRHESIVTMAAHHAENLETKGLEWLSWVQIRFQIFV